MGCVWIFAASLNVVVDDDGDTIAMTNERFNWVQKFGYENISDFELYSAAVYYSI
jgi:hypothetical protein